MGYPTLKSTVARLVVVPVKEQNKAEQACVMEGY